MRAWFVFFLVCLSGLGHALLAGCASAPPPDNSKAPDVAEPGQPDPVLNGLEDMALLEHNAVLEALRIDECAVACSALGRERDAKNAVCDYGAPGLGCDTARNNLVESLSLTNQYGCGCPPIPADELIEQPR